MATYEESGVNIELGDKCSAIAYQAAKNTFIGRKGMIGEPVINEGGFAGAMDMGDFYLVQNDDGVGTKIMVAERINKLGTMGYDLIAMVADDAICVGAETISVSNTLDVNVVDEDKIKTLMTGLETAALEQKIVIPGGEIAELGAMVNGYVWNATAIGIVEKEKVITGDDIREGDKIVALKSAGFRSNGFSLVRHILDEKLGEGWAFEKYDLHHSWGEMVLTPSIIYSAALLSIHGRYKEDSKLKLKGIAHITGGGIPGNLNRILKKNGLGANLTNLPQPQEMVQKIIELGGVERDEAYKTWNMGVGMMIVCDNPEKLIELLGEQNIEAVVAGEVTAGGKIIF
jgi:phosphoribosylformylglycinamidine cyclo-ligase